MYWARRLTRLELALYTGIIGVLVLGFLDRAFYYMELSERVSVEVTVTNVNSALQVQAAYDLMTGRRAAPKANPFDVVGGPPPNFAGSVPDADLARIARGSWIFDPSRSEVVYLPKLSRGLRTDDPHRALRFRFVAAKEGYKLVPTSEVVWE